MAKYCVEVTNKLAGVKFLRTGFNTRKQAQRNIDISEIMDIACGWKGVYRYEIKKERRQMTKADKIRKMTDEEMAEYFLNKVDDCAQCPFRHCDLQDERTCFQVFLDFLKQE